MSTPRISIVAAVDPRYSGFQECAACILEQTRRDVELILVVRSAAAAGKLPENERLTLLEYESSSVNAALNYGASFAHGEHLAFINSHDIDELKHLAKRCSRFAEFPGISAVFTIDSVKDDREPFVAEADPAFVYFKELPITVESVLIKKDIFLEAGGFDPIYEKAQGFDLLSRLTVNGVKCAVNRESISNKGLAPYCGSVQYYNEASHICCNMIMSLTDEAFRKSFAAYFRDPLSVGKDELQCERGLLLMKMPVSNGEISPFGAMYMEELLKSEKHRHLLADKYGFSHKDFLKLMTGHIYYDPFLQAADRNRKETIRVQKHLLRERCVRMLETRKKIAVMKGQISELEACAPQKDEEISVLSQELQTEQERFHHLKAWYQSAKKAIHKDKAKA